MNHDTSNKTVTPRASIGRIRASKVRGATTAVYAGGFGIAIRKAVLLASSCFNVHDSCVSWHYEAAVSTPCRAPHAIQLVVFEARGCAFAHKC